MATPTVIPVWANEHEKQLATHEERIDDLEEDHEELKSEVVASRPKKTSWIKIILFVISMLGTVTGGIVVVTQRIAERPTFENVEKVIETHSINGHPDQLDEIKLIQKELYEQRRILDRIENRFDLLEDLLDQIKKRQ
jgi:hypothetical protein